MKRIPIIIVLFCCTGLKMIGQEDSLIIKNADEIIIESEKDLIYKYDYLDLNLREEKTLVKLSIPILYVKHKGNSRDNRVSIGSTLALERKILPSISIIYDNNFRSSFYNIDSYQSFRFSGNLGIRFYHLMNKRIRESVGANNFHSNYFSIKLDRIYSYNGYRVENNGIILQDKFWSFNPSLNLSWGIQRRIGKWAYFDIGPYYDFNPVDGNSLGLNLQLGLGWGF